MLTGLVRPSSGTITVGGYDVIKNPIEAKRLFDISPQEASLHPHLSIAEDLYFYARLRGLSRSDARQRAQETPKWAKLEEHAAKNGHQLSIDIHSFNGCLSIHLREKAALDEIVVTASRLAGIDELNLKEPSLEDVFLQLTGRGLRELPLSQCLPPWSPSSRSCVSSCPSGSYCPAFISPCRPLSSLPPAWPCSLPRRESWWV